MVGRVGITPYSPRSLTSMPGCLSAYSSWRRIAPSRLHVHRVVRFFMLLTYNGRLVCQKWEQRRARRATRGDHGSSYESCIMHGPPTPPSS